MILPHEPFSCPQCRMVFVPTTNIEAWQAKDLEIKLLQKKLNRALYGLRLCTERKMSNRHTIAEDAIREVESLT